MLIGIKIEKIKNTKLWYWCRTIGSGVEIGMINLEIFFTPGTYPKERCVFAYQKLCTGMFIAALLIKTPSLETTQMFIKSRMGKVWYFYMVEYYIAMKMNNVQQNWIIWGNVSN